MVHDIMNIKWEVITKLRVAQLFHCISKFQQNPQAYRYISTWHQFENSITAEYGLLGFATFSQPYAIFIIVELATLKLLRQQPQKPAVRCDLQRDNATLYSTWTQSCCRCFTGKFWDIHPIVCADSTVMRKWKQLPIMVANARSWISTAMEFSNLRQDGTNVSMCLMMILQKYWYLSAINELYFML